MLGVTITKNTFVIEISKIVQYLKLKNLPIKIKRDNIEKLKMIITLISNLKCNFKHIFYNVFSSKLEENVSRNISKETKKFTNMLITSKSNYKILSNITTTHEFAISFLFVKYIITNT